MKKTAKINKAQVRKAAVIIQTSKAQLHVSLIIQIMMRIMMIAACMTYIIKMQ